MSFSSETIKPVTAALDTDGVWCDVTLLREGRNGRLFTARRSGKRFILKAAAASEEEGRAVAMLKREYELSMNLSHPGIAYVFTYEPSGPVGPCIVMEHVDGRDLETYLSEGHGLRERKRVFLQILNALEYIHGRNVIHNDLSPANILVSRADDSVKLIDFGFSDDDTHYLDKALGGTRAYASPELLAGGRTDARSDIWSVGMLMKDLFGRKYPAVRRKCLRQSPSGRFGSVAALRRAWTGRLLPLYVIAATALLAMTGVFAVRFERLRDENREISGRFDRLRKEYDSAAALIDVARAEYQLVIDEMEAQKEKKAALDRTVEQYKARVDAYFNTQIAAGRKAMDAAADALERNVIYGKISDEYNRFWVSLIEECPEEARTALRDYIADQYHRLPQPTL